MCDLENNYFLELILVIKQVHLFVHMPVIEIHFHLRGIGATVKLLMPGSWLCH